MNLGPITCLIVGVGWGVFAAVWSISHGYSLGAAIGGLCVVAGLYGFVEGRRS